MEEKLDTIITLLQGAVANLENVAQRLEKLEKAQETFKEDVIKWMKAGRM